MHAVNHSVTNPTNLLANNELHLYFHFKCGNQNTVSHLVTDQSNLLITDLFVLGWHHTYTSGRASLKILIN